MFRALSIDGGGMRGLYTAAYLAELEAAYSTRRKVEGLDIGKAFQLIVGTSTGAIVGCGLATGIPPRKMMELYRQHGAEVFPEKLTNRVWDLIPQLFTRPAILASGEAALRQHLEQIFNTTTLQQVWTNRGIALAIPAVSMSTYRSWVFKTPHDQHSDHRDDGRTLVDVCLASSAAPLYRSLAIIDHCQSGTCDVFTEGGLWANNPVLVTLTEALRLAPGCDEDIEIFCLGTCGKPEGEVIPREARHRSLMQWKFGGGAAAVSIAAQEYAFDAIARFLLPHLKTKVRIVRFPAEKIPGALLPYLDLDETRPKGLDALIGQARQDAHMTNSDNYRGTEDGLAIVALPIPLSLCELCEKRS
jgi:hypothetical protein